MDRGVSDQVVQEGQWSGIPENTRPGFFEEKTVDKGDGGRGQ